MKAKLTFSDETKKPPKAFVTTKVPQKHPNMINNFYGNSKLTKQASKA